MDTEKRLSRHGAHEEQQHASCVSVGKLAEVLNDTLVSLGFIRPLLELSDE